jgi:hypothetical protein
MLVYGSHNSVFARVKCWYLLVIALCDYHIPTFLSCKHRVMTTTYQHFCLTKTELWLPHTNISALQTESYDYHIPTFSLTNTELWREMLVCGSHSSVFVREKCWYVVVIALCYDYHIPTFLPYKHRAMTTTYQHFSLINTELWLPHTNSWYVVVIALCL